jgi:hypothetical protein
MASKTAQSEAPGLSEATLTKPKYRLDKTNYGALPYENLFGSSIPSAAPIVSSARFTTGRAKTPRLSDDQQVFAACERHTAQTAQEANVGKIAA